MSIRKRLFISNAAMVLMPILLFIVYFILLHIFFGSVINNGWQSQPSTQNKKVFTELTKTASLNSGKLLNASYLNNLTTQLKGIKAAVAVQKGSEIVYASPNLGRIAHGELPGFGNEGYNAMAWVGHNQYEIWQHDFFFKDGTKGSFFLIDHNGQFTQSARRFFPLIFIGFLIIVVLTNVILSYLVSRRILKPVRLLSSSADKISIGELDFHIESKDKDELGKLVNTFDDMREKLMVSTQVREQYEKNRPELIANISHDLKTPITSIRGYVEGIRDGVANTEDKLERYLDTIHAKTTYLDRLIDELLLYSKLDVKSYTFHFEKVNFKAYIKDYIEEIQLECEKENIKLSLLVEESFQSEVVLDRDQIIRVMNNIIYNSMKYMDNEKGVIQVSVLDQKNEVKVSICDNGPGVSEEELSIIFQRFYRGDPSRNSNTGGSGLGLAIAAQIIEAHGGKIWADHIVDTGLSISFTLKKNEGE